jgi:hypothetical protein
VPRVLEPWVKNIPVPLGGTQIWSLLFFFGGGGNREKSVVSPGNRTPDHLACGLVTIPRGLSRLHGLVKLTAIGSSEGSPQLLPAYVAQHFEGWIR